MAEELEQSIGSITVTWPTVSSVPTLQRLQIVGKTLLRYLVLRFSGTWDQSVGAESQATEGNPVLIQEIRINADGKILRRMSGPMLYELNRIVSGGGLTKTDPATGTGNGKAFATSFIYDMGFMDIDDREIKEASYLDLQNYANVYLEVVFNAFNAYASGNTQANMTATMAVTSKEIIGPRRLPQNHFEMLLVQGGVPMSVTGNDRTIPLIRSKTVIRGLLLRVGALAGTPVTTAITALTNVGVKGKLNRGSLVLPKEKLPVGVYQAQIGAERQGIQLTAGWLWMDLATNRRWSSLHGGGAYADLNLVYDVNGQANHLMEVYQACLIR